MLVKTMRLRQVLRGLGLPNNSLLDTQENRNLPRLNLGDRVKLVHGVRERVAVEVLVRLEHGLMIITSLRMHV
jgi:hypothetical protein